MSIAKSIQQIMEQSSWIRKMFEEGIELKKYMVKEMFLIFLLVIHC